MAVTGGRPVCPAWALIAATKKDVASAGLQLWLLGQGRYLMNAYSVFKVLKKMSFYFL